MMSSKNPLSLQPFQYFSPLYLTAAITAPLQYFFQYEAPEQFRWNPDDTKASAIYIGATNDLFQQINQGKPRILVDRGGYSINKTGLTDNLSSATPMSAHTDTFQSKHLLMISGAAEVIIEANTEGTADLLTDMVTHYLCWTRPQICEILGMKEFGLPMSVSPVSATSEDREKFSARISIPYYKEEEFMVVQNSYKIKEILTKMVARKTK